MSISRLRRATVLCGGTLISACTGAPSTTIPPNGKLDTPVATAPHGVAFQLVRNATIKLGFAGTEFLIDPMLASRGAYPGFKGTKRSELRFPLVDLPIPVNEILDADAVILTHLHEDHWDSAGRELVPRNLPIFVQNDADAAKVRDDGFTDVRVLGEDGGELDDVRLYRAGGQHGTEAMYSVAQLGELLGETMGVVFQHRDHGTVYVAGDTIWNREVEDAVSRYRPDIAVLNAGYAQLTGFDGSITMGTDDLLHAVEAMPEAKLVAVHMDTVNHAVLSRAALRAFIAERGLASERVLVPEDGQRYAF